MTITPVAQTMNTIVTVNELQLQGKWSSLGMRLGHSDVLLGNKVQGVKYRTSCSLEMYHISMAIILLHK